MEPREELADALNRVIERDNDPEEEVKAYEQPDEGEPVEGPAGFGSAGYYPGDVWPRSVDPVTIPAGTDGASADDMNGGAPANPVSRDFRTEPHDASEVKPTTEAP